MIIYNKRGAKNYKEKRLLKRLEAVIKEKMDADPSFASEFVPATNYSDLQSMYNRYVVEDAAIEEDNNNEDMARSRKPEIEDVEEEQAAPAPEKKTEAKSSSNPFIDPFNREEPIVRDYVMGDESLRKGGVPIPEKGSGGVFAEPTNFKEAFEIPTFEDEEEVEEPKRQGGGGRKREPAEPLNPSFDDMDNGKKKRSTKKFAKYIVEAVSVMAEKGFVWYANKDINDSKLAEYEMSGEIDLNVLVSLEDGQEVTIKQFFQVQCAKAEMLARWTDEQKDDLASALAEVLMEKGVAPTPTQELLLVSLTIVGGQVMTLLAMKGQTNSLLNQLRAMKKGDSFEHEMNDVPPPPPAPAAKEEKKSKPAPERPPFVENYQQEEDYGTDGIEEVSELAHLTEAEIMLHEGQFETIE